MRTAVIYYSFTGKTAAIAEETARLENADRIELEDRKKLNLFMAYVIGSFKAMKQKKTKLKPFSIDFGQYDRIIIAMPVWASMPAPAINNLIEILPNGKSVELILSSAGGDSKDASKKVARLLEQRGCTLTKTTDIRTASPI